MLRKGTFFFSVLMMALWIAPVPCPFAQRQADSSLEGLTSVHVRVQLKIESDTAASGITAGQLQNDSEALIGDAGLKIVPQEEFDRLIGSRGYPIALFDLDAKIFKPGDAGFHVYQLNFKVRQVAYLARKPVVKFLAPTWEMTDFGTTDTLTLVRERVRNAVIQFIRDFKAENPK